MVKNLYIPLTAPIYQMFIERNKEGLLKPRTKKPKYLIIFNDKEFNSVRLLKDFEFTMIAQSFYRVFVKTVNVESFIDRFSNTIYDTDIKIDDVISGVVDRYFNITYNMVYDEILVLSYKTEIDDINSFTNESFIKSSVYFSFISSLYNGGYTSDASLAGLKFVDESLDRGYTSVIDFGTIFINKYVNSLIPIGKGSPKISSFEDVYIGIYFLLMHYYPQDDYTRYRLKRYGYKYNGDIRPNFYIDEEITDPPDFLMDVGFSKNFYPWFKNYLTTQQCVKLSERLK